MQVTPQAPPEQASVPLAGDAGHALPQAPQLFRSDCVLVQAPLQLVRPEAQGLHTLLTQNPLAQLAPEVQGVPVPPGTQAPLAHASPLGHAVPQAPQLDGSEAVLSQNVPQNVPVVAQVSVSPAAAILYSTRRFASAPVFAAQVEPVRRMDWRVAPPAKVITMGPLSDQ